MLEPQLLESAGPFRRRRLLGDLGALDDELREIGGRLHVVVGPAQEALPRTAAQLGVTSIHANADVTAFATRRDDACAASCPIEWHWGTLLHPPGSVRTARGTLSLVFTPFYRRWLDVDLAPLAEPGSARVVVATGSEPLPTPDTDAVEPPGPSGARDRLEAFLEVVDAYPDLRDRPADDGTSKLSADLRFGTIGPRALFDIVGTATAGRAAFVRQLAWRDWYAHLLWERPDLVHRALRPAYDRIDWRDDPAGLQAWKDGRTGYPIVDAGMRQLRATGWMHNRVRMITASFLVKDLLIDWRHGERWFRHLLVDGDVPQNVGNWQWAAGTGPDAAPYFRVFNPTTQAATHDPRGDYIRRWVPELAGLAAPLVHDPSSADPLELAAVGVVLGDTYPVPIVEHGFARERALAAYKAALDGQ